MASMLRNQNDLVTLRCRMTFRKNVSGMGSELWEGGQQISEEVFTPLEMLGISLKKPKKEYRDPDFSLANSQVWSQLEEADHIASNGDPYTPIWLQLSRNAQALSALPWESLTREITDKPLFRVPNFLINPFTPPLEPNIAICASVPLAKASYDVREHINIALAAIDKLHENSPFRSKVTLFLDEETSYNAKQEGYLIETQDTDITLADPSKAEKYGTAAKTYGDISSAKNAIWNPWLLWILEHFENKSVDSVHFISPSYFSGENGALAFAPSPLENNDRQWSRFMGARELSDFCDRLHCNAILFSSASSPYWRIGHRLLVNELSWLRAGPIIHFDESSDNSHALNKIYATIYGREPFIGDQDFSIQASLHPDMINSEDNNEAQTPSAKIEEYIRSHSEHAAPNSSILSANKDLLESLVKGESLKAKQPAAMPQHMKIMAQKRAKLSRRTLKSPQQLQVDKGSRMALDFLSKLPKNSKF